MIIDFSKVEDSYLHTGNDYDLLIYFNNKKMSYNYFKRSSLKKAISYATGLVFCLLTAMILAVYLVKSFGANSPDIIIKSTVFTGGLVISLFFGLVYLLLVLENIKDYSDCRKIETQLDRKIQEVDFKLKLKNTNRRKDK